MKSRATIAEILGAGAVAVICTCVPASAAEKIVLFADGLKVAPGAKQESADFKAEPLRFYRFECRVRSPKPGYVAALWRNPDATWGRDLQGRPGDLRAEDYQPVRASDEWQTVVFFSRAQANAVAGCLRVQALDASMEVESASVSGPAHAEEVLTWADALLQSLAKSDGMVPPDQVTLLPRTVAVLRDGGSLRIVFLGDSIMQDAANSPVDLWIERRHPNVRVEIVTAIGGGAGMERWSHPDKFPEHDLNLKAAVIDRHPDLVLIGGISTNSVEDTRAIIARIRDGAKESGTPVPDTMLITGPFGDWRKPSVGLDAATLGALASGTNCAFLDLRAVWLDLLQRSHRDPADFYRDPIHGSALGKMSQGRLIAEWLSALGTSH